MAAGHSVDASRWVGHLDDLLAVVGRRVGRVEPRRRIGAFVRGMLAGLPRVSCWSVAEQAGASCPRGMQRLLAQAVWDHDDVLDDVRDRVVAHLGDSGAVLVIDETGDLKKGTTTVGVQRQYTGTAGRIENCQARISTGLPDLHRQHRARPAGPGPVPTQGPGPVTPTDSTCRLPA